jgi:hypothetical protein
MKQRHVDSFAPEMAAVVEAVAPLLREAGFRKRRHVFNRRASEPGLTHLVEFQMGQVWGHHGRFVIAFGYDAAEVRAARREPPKDFITAPYATVCTRVSGKDGLERWFDLAWSNEDLVEEVTQVLREEVLPRLDPLQTRRAILDRRDGGRLDCGELWAAAMLHHLGDQGEAQRELLRLYEKADESTRGRIRPFAKSAFGVELPAL